ncbi:phenylacetate--CoA ligase family protein [Halalkalibacter lacteus]|uniref:phenylacetate--CoA ligase family protein n=1 Tax=Halalkalibacter lacteus TaxID=3090663 RepID=UPI002FC58891
MDFSPTTQAKSSMFNGTLESLVFAKLNQFFNEIHSQGKNIETLNQQHKDEYYLMAINLLLEYVWDNNNYYREKLIENGFTQPHIAHKKDIEKIPFLEKDQLKGNRDLLLSVDHLKITQYHLTSGTTGKPIYNALTLADQYYHDAIPSYPTLYEGDSSSDVVGIALPYEFAQPALGFHRLYQFIFGAAIVSLGKGGYMAPLDKTVDAIQQFKISIIITTPSYAALLAEQIEKVGLSIGKEIQVRKLMLTGEGCSPQFITRLKEIWNCEIHQIYGSTECGLVGIQSNVEDGYQVLDGNVLVEIINDNGQPIEDGEVGEIVITTLLREAMPFIRYKTGDIGFLQEPSENARNKLKRLHLRGRKGSTFIIEGVDYSPILLEHFLLMIPEVGLWFTFVIEEEELTIEIENPIGVDEEELIENVKRHMYSSAGVVCEVRISNNIERQYSKVNRVFFKGEKK